VRSLRERARSVRWLFRMGHPVDAGQGVVRTTLADWQTFVRGAVSEEFGLANGPSAPLDRFQWIGADGPNPNDRLAHSLEGVRLPDSLLEERRLITGDILTGLSDIPASEWLVIGPSDLRPAVRQSAAHSFRMAAAEAHHGFDGFWHRIVELYEAGLWPAAVDPEERILAL
jgi:hypothetical protein